MLFRESSSANAARALMSTPGIGRGFPIRETPSRPSVNRIRFRRSETAKMFLRLFSIRFFLRYGFRCSTGGRDLFRRLAAELVRADGERLGDFSPRKHLQGLPAREEARREQALGRHDRARFEPG